MALVAVTALPSGASAQEERTEARAAYDDAARAYEARDFRRAAEGFARADVLAPNALALKLALAAAVQADLPVLAEELALRAESRDASADVQELARNAHRLAKGRVGHLEIACASPAAPCTANVGGRDLRPGQVVIVAPGSTAVTFTSANGVVATAMVNVVTEGTTRATEPTARAAAPATAAPAPARSLSPSPPGDETNAHRGGLDPVLFWIGAGVTAALGGVTVASGLDANGRYDDFASVRTADARDSGQSAELRTNILLGSTIAVAAVTGVVGLFFTRWGGHDREVR
jgi:hypothetical protein